MILLTAEIVTVLGALVVTFHPNILYAALALLGTFGAIAVLYVFAGADFVAGVQVVVYIGGVTVLILFALMLTQANYGGLFSGVYRQEFWISSLVFALGALPAAIFLFRNLAQKIPVIANGPQLNFAAIPKTQPLGEALLGTYLLPFEAISVLLLGSLVGAVWLARPR